jgi:hypothetical protein
MNVKTNFTILDQNNEKPVVNVLSQENKQLQKDVLNEVMGKTLTTKYRYPKVGVPPSPIKELFQRLSTAASLEMLMGL